MLFRTGSIQEPIIYGKTTRDLHMLHANQLQRPQLYFSVFFASNLPHAVTLKHFFTCGACSPQIWWILLTSPDLSCIVGTLLHVWIPAISPPFLAIFSRNFYAYSRNFSGCIFCRNFSVCISNFSVCIFNFSGCSNCCWFLFVFL